MQMFQLSHQNTDSLKSDLFITSMRIDRLTVCQLVKRYFMLENCIYCTIIVDESVVFYGTSTTVGYLMPNPVYTYT